MSFWLTVPVPGIWGWPYEGWGVSIFHWLAVLKDNRKGGTCVSGVDGNGGLPVS